MSIRPQVVAPAQDDPRRAIARELEEALRKRPLDVAGICRIGGMAQRAGIAEAAERARDFAVRGLRQFVSERNADAAVAVEAAIYEAFVKAVEDEDHYERLFSLWREDMAALGRTLGATDLPCPSRSGGVGFILLNGAILGHTEVLLRLLEFRDRSRVDARILVVDGEAPELERRARAIGVPVDAFPQSGAPGVMARVAWLRQSLARTGTATAVWLSAPVLATLALAMRIAPVQVFSALRYHPVRLRELDGYITYGSWGETERTFHGRSWTVCPVPLALELRAIAPDDIAKVRSRFPERMLLGTLARPEKIASPEFLECVARILARHPECGFVWTGQARHAGIDAFLRERGVADRCHFVGWVDTALFGAALDVFLESFPLGCGITGYQAMSARVPLVSFLAANTVFGMRYWKEVVALAGSPDAVSRELLDGYPVACARSSDEYVEIASRMVSQPAYREDWAAREARFYADEAEGSVRYSTRYFETILAIAQAKCNPS
jgi:hypothetical protein